MPSGAASRSQSKGPYWNAIKNQYVGRKIKKAGKEGVVLYETLIHAASVNRGPEDGNKTPDAVYMVCWNFDSANQDIQQVTISELSGWVTDEFHPGVVDASLIKLQKANWHDYTGLEEDIKALKNPKKIEGVPEAEDQGMADKDSNNEDEDDFQGTKPKKGRSRKAAEKKTAKGSTHEGKRKASDDEVVVAEDEHDDVVMEDDNNKIEEEEPLVTAPKGRSSKQATKAAKTPPAKKQKTTPIKQQKAASSEQQKTTPSMQPEFVLIKRTGREIPYKKCYKPGDKLLSERLEDEGDDDDVCEFDYILDECDDPVQGKCYLLKWKGYELDQENDWEPEGNVSKSNLKKWRTSQAAQKGPSSCHGKESKPRSKTK